ncbi:MAG: lytic transglycosylase domain-containing protein [Acidimicrobiia bacterium]
MTQARAGTAGRMMVVVAGVVIATVAGAGCGGDGGATRTAGEVVARTTTTTVTTTTTTTVPTNPDALERPSTPAAVAAELVRVERALRSDIGTPAEREALGWAQQHAYGALAEHPEWYAQVVAALPADVADPVARNHDAAVHLTSPSLGPAPTEPPDWTIRTPAPAATLMAWYREAEAATGVPWQYLAAIHLTETRMGRIQGNSTVGAQGPMQFMPATWEEYGAGGDVRSDHDAILAAGRYLAASGGARGDIARALFAYNPSDDYVAAVEDYAAVMAADPRAYDGYHAWQVYVTTTAGTQRLPEGWTRPRA